MYEWTYVITVLSVAGTIANIYKKWWCFILWGIANLAWCVYDIHIHEYSQAILWGVYFMLAVWGLYSWRKAEIVEKIRKGVE